MKKLILLSILLIVGCDESSTEPKEIHGCLDSNATNYNSDATIDNNSCEFNSCVYRWGYGLTNSPYFYVCFDNMDTQQECDEYYNTLLESEYDALLPYQYSDVNYYNLYNNTCEKYCEWKDYCADYD